MSDPDYDRYMRDNGYGSYARYQRTRKVNVGCNFYCRDCHDVVKDQHAWSHYKQKQHWRK